MCTGTHPFIPVPNAAKVAIIYDYFGETCVNTLYFGKASQWSSGELATLAEEVWNAWEAQVMIDLSQDLLMTQVQTTDLTEEDSFYGLYDDGQVAGSVTSPGLPGNVAFVVKFTTGRTGRSNRGRIYLPGIAENQASGNTLNTITEGVIINDVIAAIAAVEAATSSDHVIVSLCQDGDWLLEGIATTVTEISSTDNKLDSQRRRLASRGR